MLAFTFLTRKKTWPVRQNQDPSVQIPVFKTPIGALRDNGTPLDD